MSMRPTYCRWCGGPRHDQLLGCPIMDVTAADLDATDHHGHPPGGGGQRPHTTQGQNRPGASPSPSRTVGGPPVDDEVGDAVVRGDVLAQVQQEIVRQDLLHPAGYPATRDGVRLGLATVQDELDEALEAWRTERCVAPEGLVVGRWAQANPALGYTVTETTLARACSHSRWLATRAELVQVAAVALRAIAGIDRGAG